MIVTSIKTTRTTKRWISSEKMEARFDHTYTLKRVNGKLWLNTWSEKDGSYYSGSTSPINPDDSLIEKLFFSLKFDQIDYDGTPIFTRNDDVIYLATEHAVNMGEDAYTI